MADNSGLRNANKAKNDEFYTQYSDIEAEINAYVEYNPDVFKGKTILLPCDDPEWSNFTKYFASNFEKFGLKKLISTSYAKSAGNKQLTLFEQNSPLYDEELHDIRGKLFTLTHDTDGSGNIDMDDIEFSGYLEGDGDFRSYEVCKLRDEADVIITNPPFSLFREFLAWIIEGKKQFIIIGNQNAITYKEIFRLIKNNKMWLGQGFKSNVGYFFAPDYEDYATAGQHKKGFIRVSGVMWFTNIDLSKRHEMLQLDTMAHNLKFNKRLKKKFEEDFKKLDYPKYYNYDAIEVPFTECIPSDYENAMGVPITFMGKYNPEQFEIIGLGISNSGLEIGVKPYLPEHKKYRKTVQHKGAVDGDLYFIDNENHPIVPYARIIIRHKN